MPRPAHVSVHQLVRQYLVTLPRKAALQQEEEGVCKGLQVISSAGSAPQVRMHAGVSHRPSVTSIAGIRLQSIAS